MKQPKEKVTRINTIYRNFKTNRETQVSINFFNNSITVCSTDIQNFYFLNKITDFLNKKCTEIAKDKNLDISNFTITFFKI